MDLQHRVEQALEKMVAVVSLVIEIVISQVQDQRAIGHIGWICTRDHLNMQSIQNVEQPYPFFPQW